MPNPEQFQLYSLIASDFRTSPIWKKYAEESSFPMMGSHEAAHFLGFLLYQLKLIAVSGTCYCGRRYQTMLEAKNPAARPGFSDESTR